MKYIFRLRLIVGLSLSVCLSSCTHHEVYDQNYEFNSAVHSSSLDLLLLNAVRASKQYPMQFSKIQSYDGVGSPGATFSAKIPVGPGVKSAIYELDPQISLKSSIQKLTIADLNSQEAQAALHKVLDVSDYRYYQVMGGSRRADLVETLLVEEFRVKKQIFDALMRRSGACDPVGCPAYYAFREKCPTDKLDDESVPLYKAKMKAHTVIRIKNTIYKECAFLRFRAFVEIALKSKMVFYPRKIDKEKNDKTIKKNIGHQVSVEIQNTNSTSTSKDVDTKKPEYSASFDNSEVNNEMNTRNCQDQEKTGLICFTIVFRSPERIVRYLGEIIASQNFSEPRFSPYLFDEKTPFEILHVEQGEPLLAKVSLKVRDPEGSTFFVPIPNYSDPHRHRTLDTLSLVLEIINGAVSAKDLPQVNSFNITVPQ